MDITLKNITVKYNSKTALKNININIKKGESVALIGPNGSGKSTMLKLLNGLIFPEQGEYFFNNEEINQKNLKDNYFLKRFHKNIGFAFQNSETQLFCSTVYEEIAFGPEQMGLKDEEIKSRVEHCMTLLGIKNLKDEVPYTLSGGQKKRVAIASMLALNPNVIILDEPLNGLDPKCKKILKEIFITLNNAGKTIICATHDFKYTQGLFKRCLVFSKEHEIIKDGLYKTVIADTKILEENNIL